MKISRLEEEQYSEYSLLSAEYGSVFNELNWLKIFGDKVSVFSVVDNDDKLIGSFFLYSYKKLGFKYIKAPQFTPSNGLFFVGKSSNKSKISSDEKNLMNEIAEFLNMYKYDLIRISFPFYFKDFQPFIWRKYKVIPNYTYIIDLEKTQDEIYTSFSPEKRNEIKKVEKDNIQIYQETGCRVLLSQIEWIFKRNRICYDSNVLSRILCEFSNPANSFAYAAKRGNEIIAFSFCIHDKKSAYYIFGGSSSEQKHQGAGSATLWECIKRAKYLGLKVFDFEGSMNPQIERYFRGFGGSLVPYFTVNKAGFPLEVILKFIKREYF